MPKPYYPPNTDQKPCACGVCGRTLSARRVAQFHSKCTEPRPCSCGCGLRFPPQRGRRVHPQCPTRDAWVRNRDAKLLADGAKPHKRCKTCEDMPWRRGPVRCPTCRKPAGPEVIETPIASAGCGLAQLL